MRFKTGHDGFGRSSLSKYKLGSPSPSHVPTPVSDVLEKLATHYHAALSVDEKVQIQNDWQKGNCHADIRAKACWY